MTTFDSVLRDACALSAEDRERLIIHMHWSLDSETAPVDEAELVVDLDRISRNADANPDSLAEWDAAQQEIFESPAAG